MDPSTSKLPTLLIQCLFAGEKLRPLQLVQAGLDVPLLRAVYNQVCPALRHMTGFEVMRPDVQVRLVDVGNVARPTSHGYGLDAVEICIDRQGDWWVLPTNASASLPTGHLGSGIDPMIEWYRNVPGDYGFYDQKNGGYRDRNGDLFLVYLAQQLIERVRRSIELDKERIGKAEALLGRLNRSMSSVTPVLHKP